MPNWVSNRLKISGPHQKLQRLKEAVKSEENIFDFQRITPMPESLNVESGTTSEFALAVYRDSLGDSNGLKQFFNYPFAKEKKLDTADKLIKFYHLKREDVEKLGKQLFENTLMHGAPTWYEWCNKNWGTKWKPEENITLDDMNGVLLYSFDTAWAPPVPIVLKLSAMFPTLEFAIKYDGEIEPGIIYIQHGKVMKEQVLSL